jgi:DNA-binding PadR family transcriptional regulator
VVSPVFRHGRLRLYLLKLLDEAPRHGYEVIRLLQDRFLGVYAPSPGTIYPRLARLEEEGLVTHDEVDGKKIYRITEKGREEIRGRMDDLAELEEELTESVRDIAREVTQDVRDTVRNLREELTWTALGGRRDGRGRAREQAGSGAAGAADKEPAPGRSGERTGQAEDEARRLRDEARRAREQMREAFRSQRGAGPKDWGGWQNWQERAAAWREGTRWPGQRPDGDVPPRGTSARPEPDGGRDAGLLRDLERMAIEFAGDLRSAGWHAEEIGETALGQLRGILEDALARVKDEVFGAQPSPARGESSSSAQRSGGADEHAGSPPAG